MTIDKILKVEDLISLSTDMLIEAYKNGYKVEELSIHNSTNNKIETSDIHESWNPLTDIQLQEIKKSINSNLK